MDYFDPEVIEETKIPTVTEHNIQTVISARNPKFKLAALEYLAHNFSPSTYKTIIDFARYPNPEVSQKAFQILLKTVSKIPTQTADNKDLLELFLWRVMPWVNEQAKMSVPPEHLEEYNTQIQSALDALLPRVENSDLNELVLGAMNTPNYNVQIAGCQTAIHLYLMIPDKTRLSLADLLEVLLKNHMIGVKELKKNCLNVMGAVYKVFGDAVSEMFDRLGSQELVDSVKKRSELMKIREVQNTKPPTALKKSINAISVVKTIVKSTSRTSIAPVSTGMDESFRVNFDQYLNEEGSSLMLAYDEKWVKKMQIIKVDDAVAEELQKVFDAFKDARRVLYYPEINKNSLLLLKNYLIHPNKKVVSLALSVLNKIAKSTARTLQDGFPLFYSEVIEKLKTKSKQEGEIIETLIYLSSNVSLANFLRRIQKDFNEKSSALRINLIEVVSALLNNKENYDPAERKKAGNVLLELKKFSETELSKDVSNAVRLVADKIPSAIDKHFNEEVLAALQEINAPKEETPIRKSLIPKPPLHSTITESVITTPMATFIPRTGTSIKPVNPPIDPSIRLSTLRKEKREELTNSNNKSMDKYLSTSEWVTGDSRLSLGKPNRPSIQKLPGPSDITYDTSVEFDLELLGKLPPEKKDATYRSKLGETFKLVATKLKTADQFDILFDQLIRLKESLEALSIVHVLLAGFDKTQHFPNSVVRTFLPVMLSQPRIFIEEYKQQRRSSFRLDISENQRNSVRLDKTERTPSSASELVDKLLEKFGPVFFFELFEQAMFDLALFSSADVDPLFSLFLSLLVKIPGDFHPVMIVLSLLRGFLYFAHHTLSARLGELAFVMLHVYGKNNFKIFRKEFEVCGITEKVIDLGNWTPLTNLGDPETLNSYALVPFKDKILNDSTEVTAHFKALLGSVSVKSDNFVIKGFLDLCTRKYLYEVQEKESTRLLEYLAEKMGDGNSHVQRAALQIALLHSMSAKTVFKYPLAFYSAIAGLAKHKLADLRFLALRTIRYLAKSDLRFLRVLVYIMPETPEEFRIDSLKFALQIIEKDPKAIKAFEINLGFTAFASCVAAKREDLRNLGDQFFSHLLKLYEKRDFDTLIAKSTQSKPTIKKPLLDAIARVSKEDKFMRVSEDYFPIMNMHQIPKDVTKCKNMKELELFANEHIAPDLKQLLYDFNAAKVVQGVNVLKQAIASSPQSAEESFIILAKILNLLLRAEGAPSQGALVMADTLHVLMQIRQNSRQQFYKHERWAVYEYLRACHSSQLPKELTTRAAKQAVSIMKHHNQLKEFYELVQSSDLTIYKKYLAPIRPLTGDRDTSGDDFFEPNSRALPDLVDDCDQSIIPGDTPLFEGPSMQESPHVLKSEKTTDIMHASTGEQPVPLESVENFEHAVTVLERGPANLLSDALVFLLTSVSDITVKQAEEVLPLLGFLIQHNRVNEKSLTAILELISQILRAQDTQGLSTRIVMKLLDNLFAKHASLSPKDAKKVAAIEDYLVSSYAWEGICLAFVEELNKDKPLAQFAFWTKILKYGSESKQNFSPQFVESIRSFALNGYQSTPLNQVIGMLVSKGLLESN